MTTPDPEGDRQARAAWLLQHLRRLGCEFELVSHPEDPVALKLRFPDRTPEGARKPIRRQVFLHRHEIAAILMEEGSGPGNATRVDPTRTGDSRPGQGGQP